MSCGKQLDRAECSASDPALVADPGAESPDQQQEQPSTAASSAGRLAPTSPAAGGDCRQLAVDGKPRRGAKRQVRPIIFTCTCRYVHMIMSCPR